MKNIFSLTCKVMTLVGLLGAAVYSASALAASGGGDAISMTDLTSTLKGSTVQLLLIVHVLMTAGCVLAAAFCAYRLHHNYKQKATQQSADMVGPAILAVVAVVCGLGTTFINTLSEAIGGTGHGKIETIDGADLSSTLGSS